MTSRPTDSPIEEHARGHHRCLQRDRVHRRQCCSGLTRDHRYYPSAGPSPGTRGWRVRYRSAASRVAARVVPERRCRRRGALPARWHGQPSRRRLYGELARLSAVRCTLPADRRLQLACDWAGPAAGRRGEIPEQYRAEALEGEATRVMLAEQAPRELGLALHQPRWWLTGRCPGRAHRYSTGSATRSPCSTPTGTRTSPVPTRSAIVDEIENPRHHQSTSASLTDHSPRWPLPAACTTYQHCAPRARYGPAKAADPPDAPGHQHLA